MHNQIVGLPDGEFTVLESYPVKADALGDKERIADLERRVDILVRKIATMEAQSHTAKEIYKDIVYNRMGE